MIELPEIVETPAGLSAVGSSVELLEELLAEYDRELEKVAPPVRASLRPGKSVAEISSLLALSGESVNPELLAWWGWHDGVIELTGFGLRLNPLSLDQALWGRSNTDIGFGPEQWHPDWIQVTGAAGSWGQTVTMTGADSPLVRNFHVELGSANPVVSLCTPVTMWITQLREGWNRFDADALGGWIVDWSQAPESWRKLEMLQ